MIRAAILTLSDRGSEGLREDESGKLIAQLLGRIEADVSHAEILPDDGPLIVSALRKLADSGTIDLIVTTGGTGVSPRDVTPEATREVIDRELPGMAEAMRAESMKQKPHAMLSRAVAGVRGRTLIINLPGSPRAVRENLSVVLPALTHAIRKIQGDKADCGSK